MTRSVYLVLAAARRSLAGLLLLHVAAIVILAVSPRLHHWVHPDADDDGHDCAIELFLHGGGQAAPAAAHAPTPPRDYRPAVLVQAGPGWVASVFSRSRIFEHGPPVAG